nr:immunoglobulin light chain junction region [Macaca mulatta]MOW63024.1 immunoglobulin light chain junction region [Macaca mulatta]
CQQESDWNPTF